MTMVAGNPFSYLFGIEITPRWYQWGVFQLPFGYNTASTSRWLITCQVTEMTCHHDCSSHFHIHAIHVADNQSELLGNVTASGIPHLDRFCEELGPVAVAKWWFIPPAHGYVERFIIRHETPSSVWVRMVIGKESSTFDNWLGRTAHHTRLQTSHTRWRS